MGNSKYVVLRVDLDLHSDITDKITDKSKDPDHTRNSFFSENNHLSRFQLKKFLKELKSNTDADNFTRIR